MEDSKKRRKKKLTALLGFLIVFGALVYFGYNNFVKQDVVVRKDSTGLNNKLPTAEAPKALNKLELYMQAEKDSAARQQQKDNDPNTKTVQTQVAREGVAKPANHKATTFGLPKYEPKIKPLIKEKKSRQEDEIDQKMRELNKILNANPSSETEQKLSGSKNSPPLRRSGVDTKRQEDADPTPVDPELEKLDGMLDKLMNIQHPSTAKENDHENATVKTPVVNANKVSSINPNQTIQAVVHNTQTISNGSTIKLRLLTDVLVKENRISKGSFLFGIAILSGERLEVQLTNINYLNTVIPVSLSVFDIDGIEGIYIPGAVERETSKEGADQAIQSVNMANFNPTVSGQLTSAGIQATKSLLSKKVRMQRVIVKAGHHILLQNTN
jgi:conjugative transposon TraM protein